MLKPGYRTSEFWFTMVSFIFSGLFLLGVIGENAHKEELISNVSHAVESSILIGGQLLILWKYINSRKDIKKTWSDNHMDEKPKVVKNKPRKPLSKSKSKPKTTRKPKL
jgi:hypothetical protein